MDGMGAADHHGALVGAGQLPQGVGQLVELQAQQLHGGLHLQGHAGVEHIRAGHAHMDVAARIPHVLIHVGEEGDHVVAHLRLDLEDALHAEAGLLFDAGHGLRRHAAQLTIGFRGGDLHIQPALEFGLLAPDGAHLGQGVTLDQGRRGLTSRPMYGTALSAPALRLRR
jgi:hypothetical protein